MTSTPLLAHVPLPDLSAWCRSLEAAPPAARADALAQADDLRRRGGGDDDSWRVLSAYRALADAALDGPLARDRAAWMCREDPARDATTRRFAEVATRGDGRADARAEVLLAECDTHAGRLDDAERRLRALWARVRGTSTPAEVWTSNALAEVFVGQRRELEALALARRGEAAADAAVGLEPVDVAQTRSSVARALFALGDTPRLLAHLPSFLAAAAALPPTDAGRAAFHAHLLVARSAVENDAFDVARRHLELADVAHRRDPGVVGHRGHALAYARALLAQAEGDGVALRHALALLPPKRPTDPARAASRAGLEATAAAIEDDLETASRQAKEALRLLRGSPGRATPSPSVRLHEADLIAGLAVEHGLAPELGDEGLRLAADAAFERLAELEDAAKDLPTLGTPTDDDCQALGEYRTRFSRKYRAVLVRLRDHLEASARAGALPAWARAGEDGLTAVCAWCLSVRDPDGAWLPLGHLVPSTPALPVTHGICPRCRIDETARDRAGRP